MEKASSVPCCGEHSPRPVPCLRRTPGARPSGFLVGAAEELVQGPR